MPEDSALVDYADDVALLVVARDVGYAELRFSRAMHSVSGWLDDQGLSLVLSKKEIMVLTNCTDILLPLRVGDEVDEIKSSAKNLGMIIDRKLSFAEQL